MRPMSVTTADEIERILADPGYEVPAAPPGVAGLAWLRAAVSRFVDGEPHARRRALVVAELAALGPEALRRDARSRTEAALDRAAGRIDVMAAVARRVPLAALASGLGVGANKLDAAVTDAVIVGPAYLSGDGGAEVDTAVERLRALFARARADGPVTASAEPAEASAAAIAVLAQACEATAALIGNALVLAAGARNPRRSVEALVDETLRRASPIRVMTRVSPQGERVLLDLDAAVADRPLAFGGGRRQCPGDAHALALAAGVLEPLLVRCEIVSAPPPLVAHPVLRLPQRVEAIVG